MPSILTAVGCYDANGAPDLFIARVRCGPDDRDDGLHYRATGRLAEEAGYELTSFCMDETDPGWRFINAPASVPELEIEEGDRQ